MTLLVDIVGGVESRFVLWSLCQLFVRELLSGHWKYVLNVTVACMSVLLLDVAVLSCKFSHRVSCGSTDPIFLTFTVCCVCVVY